MKHEQFLIWMDSIIMDIDNASTLAEKKTIFTLSIKKIVRYLDSQAKTKHISSEVLTRWLKEVK